MCGMGLDGRIFVSHYIYESALLLQKKTGKEFHVCRDTVKNLYRPYFEHYATPEQFIDSIVPKDEAIKKWNEEIQP